MQTMANQTNGVAVTVPKGKVFVEREVKSGGKIVGKVKVLCYKEDAEGLAVAKAELSIDLLKDLNRQTVTDYMNSERVQKEITALTKARRIRKGLDKTKQAEFDAKVAALAAQYGA
jgi:hypothetical protein